MGEKAPRRGLVNFTAEQLDYKDSLARTDNKREHNRLVLKKGHIRGQQSTNLSSLNYEMRRLKHELRDIKQTSGYFYFEDDSKGVRTTKGKRSKGKTSPRKGQTVDVNCEAEVSWSQEETGKQTVTRHRTKENQNGTALPNLPTICSSAAASLLVASEKSSHSLGMNSSSLANRSQMSNTLKAADNSYANTTTETLTSANSGTKATKLSNQTRNLDRSRTPNSSPTVEIAITPVDNGDSLEGTCEAKTLQHSSHGLTSLRTMNLNSVRDRIQNRLAGNTAASVLQTSEDNYDITPFMHVPPDGLPRTVYLLPPLEDLFKEAKKARYIRKLRKPSIEIEPDDPERELDIDEIFSRKS